MHLEHFREAVRRLHCLDYHDLVMIGAFTPEHNDWADFRSNPAGWLISRSDERAEKVWKLVSKRPFRDLSQ